MVMYVQEKALRDEALERDEIYRTPTPEPELDATWLQVQELEVEFYSVFMIYGSFFCKNLNILEYD